MIFFLGWGQGQEVFFNHLNRNDSSGAICSAFSNFLAGHPVLWTLVIGIFHKKTKIGGGGVGGGFEDINFLFLYFTPGNSTKLC